ncbi:MAG: roadblock/LC7 domain-containing protein, partial [Candidatus Eisenbacteria bacterium]|nr:roadblock/LC7 domain-containing protein [Candidatus Eisenbacteria bacterium]
GRLLTMVGTVIPQFDITSFVSLSASDFAANRELARLLGEETFHDLFHQGERHGVYITQICDGMLMAVLFDRSTTLGLVRHSIRKTRPRIQPLLHAALTPPAESMTRALGEEEFEQISEDIERMFE